MSDTRWKAERPAQRLPWWAAIAFDKRFWLKVWPRGDCWEWRGYVMPEGYGQAQDANGRITTAHRIAYELAKGSLPPGIVPDHLCRHRWCVRPSHLEAVTEQVNILRGVGPTAQHAQQTQCVNGHPFDSANTYYRKDRPGGRDCRACKRQRDRRYRG